MQDNLGVSGQWTTHSSSGYAGNKVRSSYMVNSLGYTRMDKLKYTANQFVSWNGSTSGPVLSNSTLNSLTSNFMDSPSETMFVYDWLYSPATLWHPPVWVVTKLDGSTQKLRSLAAHVRASTTSLGGNFNSHARALDEILNEK